MDYAQLAEAHQRVADAHAHLAGLLHVRCDQPQFMIPEIAAPSAVPKPAPKSAKLHAPDGSFFTSGPDWRQFIIQLERQLREHFGTQPIYTRNLRKFLELYVELLPGDCKPYKRKGNTPRWFGSLQSAINCGPHCWPLGRPVIVPLTGNRGYYILA